MGTCTHAPKASEQKIFCGVRTFSGHESPLSPSQRTKSKHFKDQSGMNPQNEMATLEGIRIYPLTPYVDTQTRYIATAHLRLQHPQTLPRPRTTVCEIATLQDQTLSLHQHADM